MKFILYCASFLTLVHALLIYSMNNANSKPLETTFSKELVLKQTPLGLTVENAKATYAMLNKRFKVANESDMKVVSQSGKHYLIDNTTTNTRVSIPLVLVNNNFYLL